MTIPHLIAQKKLKCVTGNYQLKRKVSLNNEEVQILILLLRMLCTLTASPYDKNKE